MADIYTTATQLAVLSAGRTPVWEVQTDADTPPSSALDGVYLDGAVRTLGHVSLREAPEARTVRLTIPSATLSGNYTVQIDGNVVVVAGGVGSLALLIDAIVAAINADGTIGPIVTASPEGTPHDTVLIVGDTEDDYSIGFIHSGAATVLVVADLVSATLRPWWLPGARVGSTPPGLWAWSGDEWSLDRRGLIVRYDSAGLDRLLLQVSDRAGHSGDGTVTYSDPITSIGPCLSEVT